jgi:diacylglycerol kinase family enzyme
VITVKTFPSQDLGVLIEEVMALPEDGKYVSYRQLPWIEIDLDQELAINLDGEPRRFRTVRFEVLAGALPLVVPDDCPLLRAPGDSA